MRQNGKKGRFKMRVARNEKHMSAASVRAGLPRHGGVATVMRQVQSTGKGRRQQGAVLKVRTRLARKSGYGYAGIRQAVRVRYLQPRVRFNATSRLRSSPHATPVNLSVQLSVDTRAVFSSAIVAGCAGCLRAGERQEAQRAVASVRQ